MAALALLVGCASKGDLEALKQELQQANSAQLDSIKSETKTGLEATKKQLDERTQKFAHDLAVLQDSFGKLSDEIQGRRAKEEELVRKTQALQSSVQSTNRAMLELLRVQEAQLKEQLRQVQVLIKELTPGEEKPPEKKQPVEKDKPQPAERAK